MPLILRRQLEFPYTDGFTFTANGLYGNGGFDAVNQALQTPPVSTEQILHPDKYFAGEQPIAVTLDDQSATLGAGWSRVYEQTMGELNIQVLASGGQEPAVNIPGFPTTSPREEVAAGWGGDRLNMYEERRSVADRLGDNVGHARRTRQNSQIGSLSWPPHSWAHSSVPEQALNVESTIASDPALVDQLRRLTSCHIDSGALIPSRPRAAARVDRVASTNASR